MKRPKNLHLSLTGKMSQKRVLISTVSAENGDKKNRFLFKIASKKTEWYYRIK